MRFWDSSAVLPLLVSEPKTSVRVRQLEEDGGMLVWWGTTVECHSALQRLGREGKLDADGLNSAGERLRRLARYWAEVEPTDAVRRQAERLLRIHVLRSTDSLQLAAALVACQHDPITLPFLCADQRLADAARREGFPVVE